MDWRAADKTSRPPGDFFMTFRLRPMGLITGSLVGLAALGSALVATLPSNAQALTNCTGGSMALDGEETAFLGLINNYRAQNGLGPLTISTNLNRSSAWLSQDMGAKAYFSHTDSLGRSPSQRATDCGYPGGAGENIAAGTNWDSAAEAFDAWRNSAGHNANMLNGSYKVIGIAREQVAGSPYNWYWTTDFGLVVDGSGGGGGGTTPTATPTRTATQPPPPPTATPVQATKADMTSPAAGSTLPGASTAFAWTAGTGALEYFLYAGTTQGANNLYGSSTGLNRTATISNLPTNGSTVWVRLWTRSASGWQFNDYQYTAANLGSVGTKASLTLPPGGTTLRGGWATFVWSPVAGAQEYFFYIGTTPGSNNLYGRSQGLNTSLSTSVPRQGTIYVRLWTRSAAGWQYNDYSYATAY